MPENKKYKIFFKKDKKIKEKIKKKIDKYGFCIIENVLSKSIVNSLIKELKVANNKINKNIQNIIDCENKGISANQIYKKKLAHLRLQKNKHRPPKAVHDLVWMPKFAKAIACSNILEFIKMILDDHVRLSQFHTKIIKKQKQKRFFYIDTMKTLRPTGSDKNLRDWHTDWPHDPWGGGPTAKTNIGSIKEPFPDVTMSLTVIWYLSDIKKKGGTIVIPGSHKRKKSPRSLNINLYKPLKNEITLSASSGSVLIQDSRLWHSPPPSSTDEDRIAVVNRWSPWWMSINEYAYDCITNVICRPLSKKEFKKIPKKLQQFMVHLVPDLKENLKKEIVERSYLSIKNSKTKKN